MNYRHFGQLDWQPSALGFGCMRFPLQKDTEIIDEPQATRMLRDGIDQGINYIDTAYPYHNGQSEPFVGRALQDGYRQKVRLATKMPTWLTKTYQDFDKFLDKQLARLKTDHIDFYLLHALNQKRWEDLRELGVREWAEKAITSGKISTIGFSFHDMYPAFHQILNDYDKWTFCQIQYNYLDVDDQAGMQGLREAAAKGLAVVVMEPLLGGKLANPPAAVQEILDAAPVQRSPVDWALQWL
ncbi:MAG: aldo/keto reductase, partial [Anaerolineaceae bacterium]|nr:aldo/keto reductase [Anaerolineaceae bacterium]